MIMKKLKALFASKIGVTIAKLCKFYYNMKNFCSFLFVE